MTTAHTATADKTDAKTAAKTGPEKLTDKLAEKRRALGRGLESLLPGPRAVGAPSVRAPSVSAAIPPEATVTNAAPVLPPSIQAPIAQSATVNGEHSFQLSIDQIDHNPHQTRKEFEPGALKDLADSIQVQGVLQPIVVRPSEVRPNEPSLSQSDHSHPGTLPRFILILGERRLRASKLAGKTTIPVIVKRVSEQQAAEMTLVENLQRQDLDCLEQAAAFANLSNEFHLTQEEIGKRVGVSREQVSNYMRLLKLPPDVLASLRKKEITYSHARLLLSLRDDTQISKVAQVIVAKKMSVALLEEMVMNVTVPGGGSEEERKQSGARWVDPNVKAAQRSLETVLGMRVRIRDRKGKGKITIEYGTLEDFDRVVQMLQGKTATA